MYKYGLRRTAEHDNHAFRDSYSFITAIITQRV